MSATLNAPRREGGLTCEACNVHCGEQRAFKAHLRTKEHARNTGQPLPAQFECPWCHKGFTRSSGVQRHLQQGQCRGPQDSEATHAGSTRKRGVHTDSADSSKRPTKYSRFTSTFQEPNAIGSRITIVQDLGDAGASASFPPPPRSQYQYAAPQQYDTPRYPNYGEPVATAAETRSFPAPSTSILQPLPQATNTRPIPDSRFSEFQSFPPASDTRPPPESRRGSGLHLFPQIAPPNPAPPVSRFQWLGNTSPSRSESTTVSPPSDQSDSPPKSDAGTVHGGDANTPQMRHFDSTSTLKPTKSRRISEVDNPPPLPPMDIDHDRDEFTLEVRARESSNTLKPAKSRLILDDSEPLPQPEITADQDRDNYRLGVRPSESASTLKQAKPRTMSSPNEALPRFDTSHFQDQDTYQALHAPLHESTTSLEQFQPKDAPDGRISFSATERTNKRDHDVFVKPGLPARCSGRTSTQENKEASDSAGTLSTAMKHVSLDADPGASNAGSSEDRHDSTHIRSNRMSTAESFLSTKSRHSLAPSTKSKQSVAMSTKSKHSIASLGSIGSLFLNRSPRNSPAASLRWSMDTTSTRSNGWRSTRSTVSDEMPGPMLEPTDEELKESRKQESFWDRYYPRRGKPRILEWSPHPAYLWDHAAQGNVEGVRRTLNFGNVDVNRPDQYGWTALLTAASQGNVEIVRLLLARKDIDVEYQDAQGSTALSWAASNGHVEVVRLLLASGKVAKHKDNGVGAAALTWATMKGHSEIVSLLMQELFTEDEAAKLAEGEA